MKQEIKYIIGILFALCLQTIQIQAQQVKTEINTASHTYLKVDLRLDLDSLRLGKKQSLVFIPVLSDGKHKQALRSVTVNGSWRHLMYERRTQTNSLAVKCTKTGAGTVNYTDSCIYLPWMNGAQVFLSKDLCGCGGDPMEQTLQPIATINIKKKESKPVSHHEPKETAHHKVAKVTLFLDYLTFPVNRMEILPDFGNNRTELHKLQAVLDSLLTSPESRIELVNMIGYASPDGPYRRNDELAYGRTLALRDYLQNISRYRELPFRTASIAEDWQGLKISLEQSDMPYRKELLQIINMNLSPDGKEERIKILDGGKAYKILKSSFLPQLRRTVCEIHYTETYETK